MLFGVSTLDRSDRRKVDIYIVILLLSFETQINKLICVSTDDVRDVNLVYE